MAYSQVIIIGQILGLLWESFDLTNGTISNPIPIIANNNNNVYSIPNLCIIMYILSQHYLYYKMKLKASKKPVILEYDTAEAIAGTIFSTFSGSFLSNKIDFIASGIDTKLISE